MENARTISLFHGSDHIVKHPRFGQGNPHNDYGQGFYCTLDRSLACEWACKHNTDGFVNRYELDVTGLSTLNLLDSTHTVLHWIALLLANRTFTLSSGIAHDAFEYLTHNFLIDTSAYDIITGYRADDSYFSFAEAFVENSLSIEQLSAALKLGQLGEQTVLVSKRAFTQLTFIEAAPAHRSTHYPRFVTRDANARTTYREEVRKAPFSKDDVFVIDLMRNEVTADDARIQRIVSQ